MLTQRIAYFISMKQLTAVSRDRLQKALDLFRHRHQILTQGDPQLGIQTPVEGDRFHDLYYGATKVDQGIQHLIAAVQNYIDHAPKQRPFSNHSNIPEQLLRKTNLAVDLYISHSTDTLQQLRNWFVLSILIVTLVILLEVSWIFRLLQLDDEPGTAMNSPLTSPTHPEGKAKQEPPAIELTEPIRYTPYQGEHPHTLENKAAVFIGHPAPDIENELLSILGFTIIRCEEIDQALQHIKEQEQMHRPIDLIISHANIEESVLEKRLESGHFIHQYCCVALPASVSEIAKRFEIFCNEHKHRDMQFKDKQILLVDDNDINLMVLEGMVSKTQAHCELAHNGLQAVEIAQSKTFDLILMDLQMPTMNGFDATEKILSEHHNQNTPVIAVTANHDYQGRVRCHALGMVSCEAKPVHHSTIENLLYKYLK